jgi:hypothetical protein
MPGLPGLVPGLPVLREAVLAIYRPAFGRLEGYFALLLAFRTCGLMHFSGTEVPPAAKSVVIHFNFSYKILTKIFCKILKASLVYKGMYFFKHLRKSIKPVRRPSFIISDGND